jgi:hypothetical protein
MQAEESVEVDRGIGPAALRLGNRNARAQAVIIRLGKRNHDVQAVRGPALKQHYELLLPGHGGSRDRPLQKRRHGAQANHRHAALLQKIPPRKLQSSNAFTTFMAHHKTSHFLCFFSANLQNGLLLVFFKLFDCPLSLSTSYRL